MNDSIFTAIADNVFGVWFLIGAALVFFMQCGFAMVESGFTRAKNAGNIIMKNLMDFCIGALMFILIGYGLMFGENYVAGLFGLPTLKLLTDYTSSSADWSNFVFNLVFCATAATIQLLSRQLFIRLKQAGFGIRTVGLQKWDFTIMQVQRQFIWLAVSPPL